MCWGWIWRVAKALPNGLGLVGADGGEPLQVFELGRHLRDV